MLYHLIDNIFRSSPIIIIFMLFFLSFINNVYWPIYLIIILIVGDIGNHYLLKNGLFKLLYNNYGTINHKKELTLPVLGIYKRPKNATHCGLFINLKKPQDKSVGMSSGHSQTLFTFVIFLIRYLKEKKDKFYFNKILLLLLIGFSVALSRVYIAHCHTIQQVIVGSIIGLFYGYIMFDIINNLNLLD